MRVPPTLAHSNSFRDSVPVAAFAAAAAARGAGELQFYTAELPIFAVGVTVAKFDIAA